MITSLSLLIAAVAILVGLLTGKTIQGAAVVAIFTTMAFYLASTERRKSKAEIVPIGIIFVLVAGAAGYL